MKRMCVTKATIEGDLSSRTKDMSNLFVRMSEWETVRSYYTCNKGEEVFTSSGPLIHTFLHPNMHYYLVGSSSHG